MNDINGFIFSLKNPRQLQPTINTKYKNKIEICNKGESGILFGNSYGQICIDKQCNEMDSCYISIEKPYFYFFSSSNLKMVPLLYWIMKYTSKYNIYLCFYCFVTWCFDKLLS